MISPSPTQQPPEQDNEKDAEQRVARSTPARQRTGQTPLALFVKAIFRPIFKLIYYIFSFIRGHKVLSLVAVLLLLLSVTLTTYATTGLWPYGIGNDQFNFHVRGTNGGGDRVKDWLYALRNGDATTLQLLDANMSQPPDPNQLVTQFGQTKARTWKAINVMSATSQSDTSIDSFVEVDLSSNGPGGTTDGMIVFHFVTLSQGSADILLSANVIDFRKPLT
jgi:hypothetical protein